MRQRNYQGNDKGDVLRADKTPVIKLAFNKKNIYCLNNAHDEIRIFICINQKPKTGHPVLIFKVTEDNISKKKEAPHPLSIWRYCEGVAEGWKCHRQFANSGNKACLFITFMNFCSRNMHPQTPTNT